jgi:hypothetical protein
MVPLPFGNLGHDIIHLAGSFAAGNAFTAGSSLVNERKYLATSTKQLSSSITTMRGTHDRSGLFRDFLIHAHLRWLKGKQPRGAPVLNSFKAFFVGDTAAISYTIFQSGVPMGTSISPALAILRSSERRRARALLLAVPILETIPNHWQ